MLSNDDALVAFAAGYAFAVEEFEQRDRVFAGDAGPVLELGYCEPRTFSRGQRLAQGLDRGCMVHEFLADADQLAVLEKNVQECAGARGFDAGFCQSLGNGRYGEPRRRKDAVEPGGGLLLILLERDAVRGQAHHLAIRGDILGAGEQGVEKKSRRARKLGGAKIFFRPAWLKRVLAVILRQERAQPLEP